MAQPFTSMGEPISVTLSATVVQIAPGAEPVVLVVDTRNSGSTVDQYRVEVDGLHPSWYTVLVKSVPLFPGDVAQVPIQLHPPKGSATLAGTYDFTVRVVSEANANVFGQAKAKLEVGGYLVFQAQLKPRRITGRQGRFKLSLTNSSNKELQLELAGRDPEIALSYKFKNSEPSIDPASEVNIPVLVKPKRPRFIGLPQRYDFEIAATPVGGEAADAQIASGELIQRTYFRTRWVPVLLLLLLLLIGLTLCGVLPTILSGIPCDFPVLGDIRCPRVQATNFGANKISVTQGQSVTLTFNIKGPIDKATVTINDTPVPVTPVGAAPVNLTPSGLTPVSLLPAGVSNGKGEMIVLPKDIPQTQYKLYVSDANHPGVLNSESIQLINVLPQPTATPLPTRPPTVTALTTQPQGGTSGGGGTGGSTGGGGTQNTSGGKTSPTVPKATAPKPPATATARPTPPPNSGCTLVGVPGQTIVLRPPGFSTAENVTLTLTTPNCVVQSKSGSLEPDGSLVYPITSTISQRPELWGRWQATFVGAKNRSTIYFCVAAPFTDLKNPNPCGLPNDTDGQAEPRSVKVGDRITFDAWGFQPKEPYTLVVKNPDGSLRTPVPSGTPTFRITGVCGTLVDFTVNGLPPGNYTATYEGQQSRHASIIHFCVVAK